jgi:putative transposase
LANYYERVARDDAELQRIRQYILDNPAKWQSDPNNPAIMRTTEGRNAFAL